MTHDFKGTFRSLGHNAVAVAIACGGLALVQNATTAHAADARHVVVAQSGGTDPKILRKFDAIRKKAAAARAKARRERQSGPDAADRAAREAQRRAAQEQEARDTQAAIDDARRRSVENARKQAETNRAREQAARAAQLARKQAEEKKQREAQAAAQQRDEEARREAKRLADARQAAERLREQQQRQLREQRERTKKRRAEQAAQRAKAKKQAEDARKAELARQQKLQRELKERRKLARSRSLARQAAAREAETRRQLEEARQKEWQRAAKAARAQRELERAKRRAMAQKRKREAQALSTRMQHARRNRSSLDRSSSLGGPESIVENDYHVTILLIMNVGRTGVRRWSKTADPMLCIGDKCYLSEGPNRPAREIYRSKAFGAGVALGVRGLACKSTPACIFRDVNLRRRSAALQPVDLKFLHHDRRDTRRIEPDQSCTMENGRLFCDKLFGSSDWAAWIVPESVAQWAGPDVLKAALENRLQ